MLIRSLILVLAFTISIQNTCPQGWAAKTAFATCSATKQTSHCPMHKQKQSKQDGQDDVKRGISNAKQSFVLHMVEPVKTYELLGRSLGILFVDSLTLTEIFSDLILRPPISSCFE